MLSARTANVCATIALVFSLSGTAYAAKLYTGRDVRDGSLTGRDIRDGSIARADLSATLLRSISTGGSGGGSTLVGERGPAGPQGRQGAPGSPGAQGASGQSGGVGSMGPAGPVGPPGSQGEAGLAGTNAATSVVIRTGSGTLAANARSSYTKYCTGGARAVGGGGLAALTGNYLVASYPVDGNGVIVDGGIATGWRVVIQSAVASSDMNIKVFAVCVTP